MYIILQWLVLVNGSGKRIALNTSNVDFTQTFVVGWMVGGIFVLILFWLLLLFICTSQNWKVSALTFRYFSVLFRNGKERKSIDSFLHRHRAQSIWTKITLMTLDGWLTVNSNFEAKWKASRPQPAKCGIIRHLQNSEFLCLVLSPAFLAALSVKLLWITQG